MITVRLIHRTRVY